MSDQGNRVHVGVHLTVLRALSGLFDVTYDRALNPDKDHGVEWLDDLVNNLEILADYWMGLDEYEDHKKRWEKLTIEDAISNQPNITDVRSIAARKQYRREQLKILVTLFYDAEVLADRRIPHADMMNLPDFDGRYDADAYAKREKKKEQMGVGG